VIEVTNLTVRFGGVVSIDNMSVTFPGGTCGLIGPNGAGKTTFFNVLSGFVTPAEGSITVDGIDLLALADYKRARWGLRRSFQTEQAIESLSVYDNVLIVYEHTTPGSRASARSSVGAALELTGLASKASLPVGTLAASERRLVEVARAVVGNPRLVLLDEPAAGLPEEETGHLASVIKAIPDASGATAIVVEHDMSLVQACCTTTAVLDFGRLIANGPTSEVLRDPQVLAAYLGTEDVA
jgi:branched-chain amino acid transport system ATP-binding protein